MRILGALLCVAGLALVLRSALLLLGQGRPRRGPQPAFVLAGPYLRMRNPLLLGTLLAIAGAGLATTCCLLGLTALAAALAAHLWVVRVEEPSMRARFGAAYVEYLRRVPRWLPARRHRDAG